MRNDVSGYSPIQIGLHWAVVVLVAFQYVAHSGIERAWNALQEETLPPAGSEALTYLHIGAGVTILLLALTRIALRMTRGAPPPPADEPRLLQIFAEIVHVAIYVLLILLPLSGIAAWFFSISAAGAVHVLLEQALLAAITLHVAGALFQHFVRRSDVLMRMLRPDPEDEGVAASPSIPLAEGRRD